MTILELQMLLDDIHRELFLNRIVLIKENEKRYKKSEFYKKTKISLLELYRNYALYFESKYSQSKKIEELIRNIDPKVVIDKVLEVLDGMDNNSEFEGKLNEIKEFFNLEGLNKNAEELKKTFQDFKK